MRRSLFACVALVAATMAAPAFAALSDSDQSIVKQANDYLDQVHTLKAHFVQNAADGSQSEGTIYLDRPGKLRLDYDPPSPIQVITKDNTLVYYDKSLQQVSYVDIDQTLAGVLVQPHVDLNGKDLQVTGVVHQPDTDRVTVVKRGDPSQGKITLVFTEKPFQLRQWQVVDAQGQPTQVTLYDAQTGLSLDNELFVFHDPRPAPGTKPLR
ncbi:MAG TPA: outer membrane lipoprotein carrier protein LolA [Magnetospirillaceae bacterium]